MEKRSIQSTGGASFTITLPKEWIIKNNIKQKDNVNVYVKPTGSLVIQPPTALERKTKKIIWTDKLNDEEIKRELIALYILGVDEVEVKGKVINQESRLEIKKAVQLLAGFEIIEESSKNIILKNLFNLEKFSVHEGIEKMFIMAFSMFDDAVKAFIANDKAVAVDIKERDFEVDKFFFLVLRQYHSLINEIVSEEDLRLDLKDAHYFENIARQLERIADHAVKISQQVIWGKVNKNKDLNSLIQKTSKKILFFLKEAMKFTKEIDKEKSHNTLNKIKNTNKDTKLLLDKIIQKNCTEAVTVVDSLIRLRRYISNMAELTIDRALD